MSPAMFKMAAPPYSVHALEDLNQRPDRMNSPEMDDNTARKMSPVITISALADEPPAIKEILEAENSADMGNNTTVTLVDEKSLDMNEDSTLNMAPALNMADPMSKPLSGAAKLRRMIFETKSLVVCPGVYDGLSARTALELGFDALYMVSLLQIRIFFHIINHVMQDRCWNHGLPSRTARPSYCSAI